MWVLNSQWGESLKVLAKSSCGRRHSWQLYDSAPWPNCLLHETVMCWFHLVTRLVCVFVPAPLLVVFLLPELLLSTHGVLLTCFLSRSTTSFALPRKQNNDALLLYMGWLCWDSHSVCHPYSEEDFICMPQLSQCTTTISDCTESTIENPTITNSPYLSITLSWWYTYFPPSFDLHLSHIHVCPVP